MVAKRLAKTYMHAIESVLALFAITVYIAPNLNIFWYASDPVKISKDGNQAIDYNSHTTVENLLGWYKKA